MVKILLESILFTCENNFKNSIVRDREGLDSHSRAKCNWRSGNSACITGTIDPIFAPFFYLQGTDCQSYQDDLSIYEEKAYHQGIISFPSPKNFSLELKADLGRTQLQTLRGMKRVHSIKDKHGEIFLDFTFRPPKIEFAIREQPGARPIREGRGAFDNINLIEIEGVGRSEVYSKLEETVKYLRSQKEKDMLSVKEFFKFHFRRENRNEIKDEKTQYLKKANKEGVISAYISNKCQVPQNKYNHDHHFFQLACDFNYSPVKQGFFGLKRGPSGMGRNCYFGRDSSKVSFGYAQKFMEAYKGKEKFLEFKFIDANERSSIGVGYLDSEIKKYLEFLKKYDGDNNERTLTVLYSRNGNPYYRGVSNGGLYNNPFLIFLGAGEDEDLEDAMLNLGGKEQSLLVVDDLQKFMYYFFDRGTEDKGSFYWNKGGKDYFDKSCEDYGISRDECFCKI